MTKDGWKTPFDAQRFKGIKPTVDLIDAKTGQVVVEAGKKITPRLARKIAEDGVKDLLVQDGELYGLYLADELVDEKTGEIYAEAGDEISEKC
jgi:DNA-directed RNA polymerase subunit beta